MTQLDTNPALPRTATGRQSTRGGPGLARLRTHLTVLEAERERHAKARFDTGGDIGDRAWRVEGETHMLALDSSIRRLRQSLDEVTRHTTDASGDQVEIGATVTLRFFTDVSVDSAVEHFVVGGLDTQDEDCPVLTPDSPLGRVLLGARVGDTVAYASPRGKEQVVVLQIG